MLFSDVILQIKYIGGQTKAFLLFSFVPLMMRKYKNWRALIYKVIAKQSVKNEQIKRKQICSVSFVKVLKLQEKFKIAQNNF